MRSDSSESGSRLSEGAVAALLIVAGISLFILPCRADDPVHVAMPVGGEGKSIDQRLDDITVSIEFNNATLTDAFKVLRKESRQCDPDQRGVYFNPDTDAVNLAKNVTLKLHNVSVGDATRNICKLAGVKMMLEDSEIHIVPPNEDISSDEEQTEAESDSHHIIVGQLQSIVIDRVHWKGLDVATAMDFLADKSESSDSAKRGVNFVLGNIAPADHIHRRITIAADNISLGDLLVAISQQTGFRYFVEDGAVYFKP